MTRLYIAICTFPISILSKLIGNCRKSYHQALGGFFIYQSCRLKGFFRDRRVYSLILGAMVVTRRGAMKEEVTPEVNGDSSLSLNTDPSKDKNSLKDDYGNIALLLLLYVLQGVPLGLTGSVPLILQSRNVAYKDQAMFSFAFWPFSVKLLWAPIVDALYSSKMGRRKSWLVPIQYLIGLFIIVLSWNADSLLGQSQTDGHVDVFKLTMLFFSLCFLAATQDIATDGWALTMLSTKNVGYASTCNSVGQTAGFFLGNICFLALTSPDLANKYLRSEPQVTGIIKMSDFLLFWGLVFIITTTFIWIFKHEKDVHTEDDETLKKGVVASYRTAWKIICLPNVRKIALILLTIKMGFAITDAATGLKLVEAGVPKETLAMLAVPMIPLQIILPWLISRYSSGPRPLDISLKAMPFRLLMGIVFALCVWWAHHVRAPGEKEFPVYFFMVILLCYALHQITTNCMFVAIMAFNARVSDPTVGGTYMTLLNTLSNLGGVWTTTSALWFVDVLTWKTCVGAKSPDASCASKSIETTCTEAGGSCNIEIDGYFLQTVICVIIGFMWLRWKKRETSRLQDPDLSTWKCQ